jgi:hypothetical protein
MRKPMDVSETTEIRRTRVPIIAVITLVILVIIAAGVYVVAFVILSPMIG